MVSYAIYCCIVFDGTLYWAILCCVEVCKVIHFVSFAASDYHSQGHVMLYGRTVLCHMPSSSAVIVEMVDQDYMSH